MDILLLFVVALDVACNAIGFFHFEKSSHVNLLMLTVCFYFQKISLQSACRHDPDNYEAQRAVDLLYDTALISSGFAVSSQMFILI